LSSLILALNKEGIQAIARRNDSGLVYGITYVDHQTKCVFNGSDLGKQYSAKAIQDRCGATTPTQAKAITKPSEKLPTTNQNDNGFTSAGSLADALLQPEYTGDTLPFELKRNKKKKRKRLSNNQ